MNIAGARAFLAVVATKSISKAAETLFLTQSTVSFQLKSLEEDLGIVLIERKKGHRQIDITTKGTEFIPIAERYVQTWNDAHALKDKKNAILRVSSVDSLHVYTFAKFYDLFMTRHPEVRLKIHTHQTPEIFDYVDGRTTDIGFVLSSRRYPNIHMVPLFSEKLMYVHLAEHKKESIHASELDFSQEVLLDWGPEFMQWHNIWCPHGAQPTMQVDTISLITQYLRNKRWAVLPISIFEHLTRNTALPLAACIIDEGPSDRVCFQLTNVHAKAVQNPYRTLFEEELHEYLKDLKPWGLQILGTPFE